MSTVIYKAVLSDGEDEGVYNRTCSTTFKARYFKVQTNHLDADQKKSVKQKRELVSKYHNCNKQTQKIKIFLVKNREI